MKNIFEVVKRWSNRTAIKAINEAYLEEWLQKIGLQEQISAQTINCAVCGDLITLNNLELVANANNNWQVVCDKITCIHRFQSEKKQK